MAEEAVKWQHRRRSGSASGGVVAQAVKGGTFSEVAAQAAKWQGPLAVMVHAVLLFVLIVFIVT
jgi:hypothetical protein